MPYCEFREDAVGAMYVRSRWMNFRMLMFAATLKSSYKTSCKRLLTEEFVFLTLKRDETLETERTL